jgi:UDP-glucose:(heptosyl)LPS alpha-1,3-glucosyltransferase
MKVAITHTRYTAHGGVERYAWDLVKRLLDGGHEVHFFAHFWDEQRDPRVHLHRIPNPWKQIRFMKVWSFDRWLTRHVRPEEWDVVHGFSKSSLQDIYTDGSGCLADYQGYSIDQAGGGAWQRRLRRASLHQRQVLAIEQRRFTRGNFRRIVTMSDLAGEQIRRRYGLGTDEVVTIYNGIDTARFHPGLREQWRAEYFSRLVIPPDAFVVVCVGNDYRRKGVPTLIEAARILKERGLPGRRRLRICVVGKERPRREKALSRLARQKGVWDLIKFYGTTDAVERWHGLADLFVLPTRFDAFGNVILESMAAGVPTLVSSRAGAAEVVLPGKTGWVLPDPGDAQEIAERIIELAGDEERRQAMGRAARTAAEGYSWDRHFQRMLALYQEVAAEKRRSEVASA